MEYINRELRMSNVCTYKIIQLFKPISLLIEIVELNAEVLTVMH